MLTARAREVLLTRSAVAGNRGRLTARPTPLLPRELPGRHRRARSAIPPRPPAARQPEQVEHRRVSPPSTSAVATASRDDRTVPLTGTRGPAILRWLYQKPGSGAVQSRGELLIAAWGRPPSNLQDSRYRRHDHRQSSRQKIDRDAASRIAWASVKWRGLRLGRAVKRFHTSWAIVAHRLRRSSSRRELSVSTGASQRLSARPISRLEVASSRIFASGRPNGVAHLAIRLEELADSPETNPSPRSLLA